MELLLGRRNAQSENRVSKPSARDTPSHREVAIYRKAARLIENDLVGTEFSCHAIYKAKNGRLPNTFCADRTPEIVVYSEWFRPDALEAGSVLWFVGEEFNDDVAVKCQRVLMLCLMADILERP